MGEYLISIIISIYGVDKYLNDCIKSVVHQTYNNLEIILIDDGSRDNCPLICDEWSAKDNRIKVVHKQNAGLGMARNTGIENATGDYICFFDGDDFVEPQLVQRCINRIKCDQSQIVLYGHNDYHSGKYVRNCTYAAKTQFFENEIQNTLLPDLLYSRNDSVVIGIPLNAWSAMYSMQLIKEYSLRFVSEREIISEDYYSLLEFYKNCSSVSIIPEALYNYRVNDSSLTHVYKEDRYVRILDYYVKTKEKRKELYLPETLDDRIKDSFLSFSIGTMKLLVDSDKIFCEKMKLLKAIINESTMQSVLKKDYSYDTRNRVLLFNLIKSRKYCLVYGLLWMKNRV